MKRMVLGCWCMVLGGWCLAGTFPYAGSLTERYSLGATEVSSFDNPVTATGSKMKTNEHVAVIETAVADFCASDDANWATGVAAVLPAQAVLSMKLENGVPVWMGYTANGWVQLTGKTAVEGEWGTKVEIDYSVTPHQVRYSVKAKGESAYTVLKNNNRDWLALGGSATKAGDVKLYGFGEVSGLTGRCATRPIEAKVSASESYDMSYANLKVDASVSEAWGAENFDVVLRDANGVTVATKTATVASGRLVADFSDVAVPGGTYSYSVVLSGIGQQGVVAKGKTDVELFSNVDWFGFKGGALVKASKDANADVVSNALVQKTDATAEGKVLPATHASDGATVTTVTRLAVNGVYMWQELSTASAAGQFAIAPCRLDNSDDLSVLKDRAWAYRVGSGAWTAVTGVPTANGSYDVKVVFDYKAKTGNCWIKTSGEGDASYRPIASNFALTDATLNNAAVVGGGISEMNASYRTTAPAEVLPTGNTIVIDKNAEVRLENLTAGTAYAVQGASGKAHLRWKDAKGDSGTIRWAKVVDGKIEAVDGAPANRVDSFKSHVLGLDPEDAQSKPFLAAEQNAEPDKLVLKLPKVRQRDPSQTGVAVTYRLMTSGDPSFATGTVDKEVTDVPAGEGPTFTTELPTSGGKVKYYRVEIELGK